MEKLVLSRCKSRVRYLRQHTRLIVFGEKSYDLPNSRTDAKATERPTCPSFARSGVRWRASGGLVATDVGDDYDGQFSRLAHPGFDFHQTADC